MICAPKTKEPHAARWRWLLISSHGRCGAPVGADALLYLRIVREDAECTDGPDEIGFACIDISRRLVMFELVMFEFMFELVPFR